MKMKMNLDKLTELLCIIIAMISAFIVLNKLMDYLP